MGVKENITQKQKPEIIQRLQESNDAIYQILTFCKNAISEEVFTSLHNQFHLNNEAINKALANVTPLELLEALLSMVYEENGKYYIGQMSDTKCDDIVQKAIEKALKQ